mmetsp:Transcript_68752/g.123917  ORF Transcript_68752/g.123917 Transcript_68752/m.123917 type:complete len:220 (+) Transcript_68752:465-1124(+)
MVSLTTLKMFPPSCKKTVPWLPEIVTKPSASSFIALPFTRMISTSPSATGWPRSSITSPTSSLRKGLLSLMLTPSVMTVPLTTFMKQRRRATNLSLLSVASDSAHFAKTLSSSSAEGSGFFSVSSFFSSFSHFSKKLMKPDLSSTLSLPLAVDIASKRSSVDKLLTFWWYLSMDTDSLAAVASSAAAFFSMAPRILAFLPPWCASALSSFTNLRCTGFV